MVAKVSFTPGPTLALLFGFREENLKQIEASLGVAIGARGNEVAVRGERPAVERAVRVLETMKRGGGPWTPQAIRDLVAGSRAGAERAAAEARPGAALEPIRTPRGSIIPRGDRQSKYVRAIRSASAVFGLGPAGTGKTYLAVGCALEAYAAGDADRIVLTRPVVEAGERLGFLPGDVQEKVNPYMRPLYDALADMLDPPALRRLLQQETIEIAPLAFMRGRTLNRSFIILDEGQNTTVEQMKMFLTRLGAGSRAVITGDVTQIDLPRDVPSGLIHAAEILRDVPGLEIVRFGPEDVVRHELIARILESYARADKAGRRGAGRPTG